MRGIYAFMSILIFLGACSYPIEAEWPVERRFINVLPTQVTLVIGNQPGDTTRYEILSGDTIILPAYCIDGICRDHAYKTGVGADEVSLDVPGSSGHFLIDFSDGHRAQYKFATCDSIGKTATVAMNDINAELTERFPVIVADTAIYCGWQYSWRPNPRTDEYTYIIDSTDYRWAR